MSRTDPSSFHRAAWAQLQHVAASRRDVVRGHLKGLLEALVFAGSEPLPIRHLARAAKAPRQEVELLMRELQAEYRDRGVRLEDVGGGFTFRTAPAYGPFVRELVAKKPVRMSRALLETLAIISYRQPITRPEIDDIRGVDSGPVLRTLLDRDLIRILGKKEEPGRPLLYSTTEKFLQLFGLTGLASLPTLREFTELTEDSRHAYEMETGDEAPLHPIDLGGLGDDEDAEAGADEDDLVEPAPEAGGSTENDLTAGETFQRGALGALGDDEPPEGEPESHAGQAPTDAEEQDEGDPGDENDAADEDDDEAADEDDDEDDDGEDGEDGEDDEDDEDEDDEDDEDEDDEDGDDDESAGGGATP